MKTQYTFESNKFQSTLAEQDESHEDFINPGIYGRELANYLMTELQVHKYRVCFHCPEDWGYWIEIEHDRGYTLGFGCSNIDHVDPNINLNLHRVFVTPDKSVIRPMKHWFRKVNVHKDVEKLVATIGAILSCDEQISNIALESI